MQHSAKFPKRLSIIFAATILTTASIVFANRSEHSMRTTQDTSRHIAPTTTSRPSDLVQDNLAMHNSSNGLSAATPTPSPSRIYRVIPVTSDKRFEPGWESAFRLGEGGEIPGRAGELIQSTEVVDINPPFAAVWRNGVVQTYILPGSLYGSFATDINSSGKVVGHSQTNPIPRHGLYPNAYILPDIRLPAFENSSGHMAFAINNVGQVIGVSTPLHDPVVGSSSSWPRGVLWDTKRSGNPVELLKTFEGEPSNYPLDINDNGVIVGVSSSWLNVAGQHDFFSRAVVWKDGHIIDIATIQGLDRCRATRINSSNYVLGYCEAASGVPLRPQGFLWHDDNDNGASDPGELRDLRPYFPQAFFQPSDINDSGQMVSDHYIFHDDNGNGQPDLGETKDLNSLLIDSSCEIMSALAINNRGQILAYSNTNNCPSSFLLLDPILSPVIFVPGILGSTLKDGAEEMWFGGVFKERLSLSLFPKDHPSTTIQATDAIRAVAGRNIYGPFFEHLTDVGRLVEYQVNGLARRRTTSGCDLAQKKNDPDQNPNFFVFAYDWRKSNIENAAKLKDYVGCVRRFHPDTKVNVIAHSMGGLLARRYILDNPNDHHVDKLITVATPWLGAPQLLHAMETGEVIQDLPGKEQFKYLIQSFAGAHELLPSRAYQFLGGEQVFVEWGNEQRKAETGYDYDENGFNNEGYSYDHVLEFLDKRAKEKFPPRPGQVGPGTAGDRFHGFSTALGKQDDWREDSTGVNYFHFYGVMRQQLTITQVKATCYYYPCTPTNHKLDVTLSEGDGTVPTLSASRRTDLFNFAPNAKVFPMISQSSRKDAFFDHTGLLNNSDVREAILTLLRGGTVSLSSVPARIRAKGDYAHHARRDESAPASYVPIKGGRGLRSSSRYSERGEFASRAQRDESALSYYIYVIGGANVLVTDTRGNSTALIEGDWSLKLPEVHRFSLGPNAELISLPVSTAEQYNITFTTSDEPLIVRIIKGESNVKPTAVTAYQDIVLPKGVSAKLIASSAGVENLRYDSDGDGTYDASVSPTVVPNGTAGLDTTPPTLAFNESPVASSKTQITITASDSGTGVRNVHYSTDGVHFQAYTSPVVLDPTRTSAISAVATDKAGNRSPIISYSLGTSPPVLAPVDTDGDGQRDSVDADDDNDGQSDLDERDCGSDPLNRGNKATDTDGDNRPNCVDSDDDGDNHADENDNCPQMKNHDQTDSDGDGKGDVCDETPGRPKSRSWLSRLIRWLLSPFR